MSKRCKHIVHKKITAICWQQVVTGLLTTASITAACHNNLQHTIAKLSPKVYFLFQFYAPKMNVKQLYFHVSYLLPSFLFSSFLFPSFLPFHVSYFQVSYFQVSYSIFPSFLLPCFLFPSVNVSYFVFYGAVHVDGSYFWNDCLEIHTLPKCI